MVPKIVCWTSTSGVWTNTQWENVWQIGYSASNWTLYCQAESAFAIEPFADPGPDLWLLEDDVPWAPHSTTKWLIPNHLSWMELHWFVLQLTKGHWLYDFAVWESLGISAGSGPGPWGSRRDLAYTPRAIGFHTDNPYRDPTPVTWPCDFIATMWLV